MGSVDDKLEYVAGVALGEAWILPLSVVRIPVAALYIREWHFPNLRMRVAVGRYFGDLLVSGRGP